MNPTIAPPPASTIGDLQAWYVMTFREPRFLRELITDINARRLLREGDASQPPLRHIINTFWPHEFLQRRPQRPAAAADPDTDEQAFRLFERLIFVRTTLRDARRLVNSRQNKERLIGLRFYLDTDGSVASVPDAMMDAFINACVDKRGQFRLIPPISGIEANDRVRIEDGPFAGQEATVVRARQSHGQVTLELSIPLVAGAVSIRMQNVRRHQVAILGRESSDAIRADFIDYTQRHLVDILAHRVKRVQDVAVNRRDADMLNRLYRYRTHEVEGDAAAAHFLALMLICAHLCRDAAGTQALTQQALSRLAVINARSESRAATDTRAYLWIALYIATGQTDYSRLAKQYVAEHQPKSRILRRFVALIRKGKKV